LGQVLDLQFTLLWNNSKLRSFRPGCTGMLEVELGKKNWVKDFQDQRQESEKALEIITKSGLLMFGKPPQAADEEPPLMRRG
jgi:hypothetical protein